MLECLKGTKFVITVCRIFNVNGAFTHFDNFLRSTYWFDFWLTKFQNEFWYVDDIPFKNEYPESVIDK